MHKAKARSSVAACLVAATGLFLLGDARVADASERNLNLQPPTEVTPEIVAGRGCIEGVAHPSERDLTVSEQTQACDDFVQLENGAPGAVYFRGLHLFENGLDRADRDRAFDDFTTLIEAEDARASTYRMRAVLLVKDRDELEPALADLDRAIELTAAKPRPSFHTLRALVYFELGYRASDEALVHRGLKDVALVKELDPNRKDIPKLEAWAAEFLRKLSLDNEQPVNKG